MRRKAHQMVISENTPKRGMWKKMVVLFLPKSLTVRLTVSGLILTMVGIIVPTTVGTVIAYVYSVLFIWAFIVAIQNSMKRKGHRAVRLFGKMTALAGGVIACFMVYFVFLMLANFLAFMSAGGNAGFSFVLNPSFQGTLGDVELYLLIVTVVLLVWIPQAFFSIKLDVSGTGDAQRVVLALITAVSCAMTGISFLLFHFDGGPLSNVNVGALVVGIIGTVLLVAHPYRSLARACWQHGIVGVFSLRILKQRWDNMVTELEEALEHTAEQDVTPSSAASPAAEKKA
jgi:hypothetical protein